MGTNYYLAENKCDHCNREDRIMHIGKSSMGWAFNFQGYRHSYKPVLSWADWKEYLKDRLIVDEYGTRVPYDLFCEMIETYKSPKFVNKNGQKNLSHNEEARKAGDRWFFNPEHNWDDPEGYSFTSLEFS